MDFIGKQLLYFLFALSTAGFFTYSMETAYTSNTNISIQESSSITHIAQQLEHAFNHQDNNCFQDILNSIFTPNLPLNQQLNAMIQLIQHTTHHELIDYLCSTLIEPIIHLQQEEDQLLFNNALEQLLPLIDFLIHHKQLHGLSQIITLYNNGCDKWTKTVNALRNAINNLIGQSAQIGYPLLKKSDSLFFEYASTEQKIRAPQTSYFLPAAEIPSLVNLCIPHIINRIRTTYTQTSLAHLLDYVQQTNFSLITSSCLEKLYELAQKKYSKTITGFISWFNAFKLTPQQEQLLVQQIINHSTRINTISKQIAQKVTSSFILRQLPSSHYGAFIISPTQTAFIRKTIKDTAFIDCITKKPIRKLPINLVDVCFSFSPDGAFLASQQKKGTDNNLIKIWDVNTGKCIKTINSDSCCAAITFIPNNKLVYSTQNPHATYLHDFNTNQTITVNNQLSTKHAFSRNGPLIAINEDSKENSKIHIYDYSKHSIVTTYTTHKKIYDFAFSPTSNVLAYNDEDAICLLDIQAEKSLKELPQKSPLDKLVFSPNGALMATLKNKHAPTAREEIQIIEIQTGECITTIPYNTYDLPNACAFSYDNRRLFVSFENQIIEYSFYDKKQLEDQSLLTMLLFDYALQHIEEDNSDYLFSDEFKLFIPSLQKLPDAVKKFLQDKIKENYPHKHLFNANN